MTIFLKDLYQSFLKCCDQFLIRNRANIITLLIVVSVGTVFSALIPPFQSPDEMDHLRRAYFLSQGRIAMETPPGQSTGGMLDTGLNAYMASFNRIAGKPHNRLTREELEHVKTINWSGEERFGAAPGVAYYFPAIYLPQAIGLAVGKWAGWSLEKSYYLARFLALITATILILCAVNVYSPGVFALALLAIPMTLFQLCSTGQDGIAIGLVMLVASLFMRITTDYEKIRRKHFITLCIATLILTTSRINLFPLLILSFIAAFHQSNRRVALIFSCFTFLLSIAWVAYAVFNTVDLRITKEVSTSQIALHYLTHPSGFFEVLANTVSHSDLRQFYVNSFFGILGWLDTNIGIKNIGILFKASLLILISTISIKRIRMEFFPRLVLLGVAMTSVLLTFFLLLVTWNKHPASVIDGVQGRYLIAPFIILGYALTERYSFNSRIQKIISVGCLLIVIGVSVVVTPAVLVERYFISSALKTD